MAKKNGIYPWIKSIFGKKKPTADAVYAGPRPVRDFEEDDGPVMEEVYAGPEFYEQSPDEPEEIEAPVYAGPEFFEEPPMTKVYAGPVADEAPDEVAEDVIAQEETPPAPPREFMCVYAGPEYFRKEKTGVPFMTAKTTVCPECGAEYPEGEAACPKCGKRTVFEDGTVACAKCGAHVDPAAKFCENCGEKQE